ncbi:MAG: TonB-dependent receptor, partial [Sphingosinicella sp.]
MPLLFVAALLASETPIIVTAARQPVAEAEAPVSATTFEEEIEALAPLLAVDLLRLAPGVAVAQSGPRGSQAQVRIRGAEANHTLLFIDGIRFNDPAAGNEARFELLAADPLARLELVHGPQSALWGSEALGGVIAAETADPLQAEGIAAAGEYGELDSVRLFGRGAFRAGPLGIAAAAGWQVSDGVDALGAGGDLDGFRLFNANLKARARLGAIELGLTGLWLDGRTDFDGFDPVTFLRADTLDRSDNRIGAAGISADGNWGAWSARGRLSYLDSINRNSLGGAYQNHTTGSRVSALAQLSRTLGRHTLIAAAEHDRESFRARDVAFGGFSNQDRSRMASALVAEWRAAWSDPIHTDLAVRHDMFSAFADATTLRAAVLVRPGGGWSLHVG